MHLESSNIYTGKISKKLINHNIPDKVTSIKILKSFVLMAMTFFRSVSDLLYSSFCHLASAFYDIQLIFKTIDDSFARWRPG